MARRGRGEGTIRKRTDGRGRWEARYVGSDGKQTSIYADTREEVQNKLREAVGNIAKGDFVALGASQSTADYLTAWLRLRVGVLRPRTIQRYEQLIRIHALPAIGAVPLRKLRAEHLRNLYGSLHESQAPASIAQLHAVLHGALGQAVSDRHLGRNPADGAKPPRVKRRRLPILSPEEIGRLLDALADDALAPLYVLAVNTGLRQGELLGLRWRDVRIDWRDTTNDAGTIEVNATLSRIGTAWVRTEPKTDSSWRTVQLTKSAVAALRSHRARMLPRLLAVGRTGDEELVFLTDGLEPINGFHITERHLKPLLVRAGLPSIRFHDLRHAFASLMLSNGVRVDLVSQMLGHKSPAMTLEIYAHLMPGDQDEALRRLDAALSAVRHAG